LRREKETIQARVEKQYSLSADNSATATTLSSSDYPSLEASTGSSPPVKLKQRPSLLALGKQKMVTLIK
jgi:hypothetical protein